MGDLPRHLCPASAKDKEHPDDDGEPFSRADGARRRPRLPRALPILAIVGSILGLWAQPAAASPTTTEFPVSSVGVPQGVAAGPDGNLWFTQFYDDQAGRITPQGATTLVRLNTVNSATYITSGPTGALWLTLLNDAGSTTTNQIGRLTTRGALTTFTVPTASWIWDIATGPDGNLYVTDFDRRVWQVTPTGHFTAFPFTNTKGYPYQITRGQDGNLWFTWDSSSSPRIGRITPSGAMTLFSFPNPSNDLVLMNGIAAGPDGNLWFTYQDFTKVADAIGRITPGGAITLTPTPTPNAGPTDITAGPDGNMWFTEAIGNIGRITTH